MTQVLTHSFSDMVRNHVTEFCLKPAVRRGETAFTVSVGDVHRALGLHNRVPLVCAALKSRKFLQENGLRIVSRTGPPSGQSTTVKFTYAILGSRKASPPVNPLLGLRGIAKDLFAKLGGGEAFIRSERGNFKDRQG